ncbi:hypothetical protein ACQYAD_10305 [Neobacillus sp. SM06]|uniref:hypothetical protein n=1 Tax=Neobacillus sp. SM06 TaxID=3422492 RepID=UPI003D2CD3E5
MQKFLLIFLGSFLIFGIFFWSLLSPSISEDDVQLTNDIKIISTSGQSDKNQVDKLEVSILLKNKSSKPLFNKKKDYLYTVYLYNPSSYRFLKIEYANQLNPKELLLGSDSRTKKRVIKDLKNANIPISYKNGIVETPGFMYLGRAPQISMEYYFIQKQKVVRNDNFYVVFSFYQKKYGKNLSWSKIYTVEVTKNESD